MTFKSFLTFENRFWVNILRILDFSRGKTSQLHFRNSNHFMYFPSFCLSVLLSFCLSVFLPLCLPVFLSFFSLCFFVFLSFLPFSIFCLSVVLPFWFFLSSCLFSVFSLSDFFVFLTFLSFCLFVFQFYTPAMLSPMFSWDEIGCFCVNFGMNF